MRTELSFTPSEGTEALAHRANNDCFFVPWRINVIGHDNGVSIQATKAANAPRNASGVPLILKLSRNDAERLRDELNDILGVQENEQPKRVPRIKPTQYALNVEPDQPEQYRLL